GGVHCVNRLEEILRRHDRPMSFEHLDRDVGRDLATRVAPHAVGDREQTQPRDQAVLVGVAHTADIGGNTPGERCHCSSITTLPMRTRSPVVSSAGLVTFSSLRKVPLVEPRASMKSWSSRRNIRAWSCDTNRSSSAMWHPAARPTVSSSSSSYERPRCSSGATTMRCARGGLFGAAG